MALEVTDILTDDAGDLLVKNGDDVIGESTLQHQRDLILTGEGEYKHDPTVGIGVVSYLDDESPSAFLRKLRIQFTKDGMNVAKAQINALGKIVTEAVYE